ncbi:hypothetical protein FGIG_08906 [Fasciola gigantica]|uniref:Retrotransposon gag domain-containing protein n=1 Tax=Fasciola gigantica TaxID=46835 RepID=A0A504YRF9_FASGI|nr:hypothetical protein FGIG_08906 [Fasciola gigantica]
MVCNTNQTKSRSAVFPPAVPALKAFSPGDGLALWAVRAKALLQDTLLEGFGQCLLPLLDDDAARQFLAAAVPILSGSDILWSALGELFARYEMAPAFLEKFLERRQHLVESVDEYAAYLSFLAKKAYPKTSKEVCDEHILRLFTMGISYPKTEEDFHLKTPTSLQSALLLARKLGACREALRQLPNEAIAAIQPTVFKPQPSRTPSVSHSGSQPYCRCCRKFGSGAQHCGRNPAMQYTGESQYRVMSLPFVSLNNNDRQSPLVIKGLLNGKAANRH